MTNKNIKKSILRSFALSVGMLLANVALAIPVSTDSNCLLSDTSESCVRLNGSGALAYNDYGIWETVVMTSITPNSWTADETTPDPLDWLEFNIVFEDGFGIQASNMIVFTDRFKLKGVTGNVGISLWLTDENHEIIDPIAGFPNGSVAQATANTGSGPVDENGFETFNLSGWGMLTESVTWWDYHIAFDFRDAEFSDTEAAAVELIAPSSFSFCYSGTQFTDGPCAFGNDISLAPANFDVATYLPGHTLPAGVPEPAGIALIGLGLLGAGWMRRRI